MTNDARDDAVKRLEVALAEEDRLGDRYRAALGTSSEFSAYARLQGASDDVTAREAWLKSIDDDTGGGRIWVNGRKAGGADSLFVGLEDSHD